MKAQTLGTIREWQLARFTVRMTAVEDYDIDLSWDEDGSMLAALERGHYVSFGAVCTVYLDGTEVGSDSLWGCVYANIAEFQDHKVCAAQTRKLRAEGYEHVVVGSYFADLVHGAIADARQNIAKLQSVYIRKGVQS